MINHRHLLLITFLSLMSQLAFGQLTGSLTDEKGEALSFANVALLSAADSAIITGAVTDLEGAFQINSPKQGEYRLRMSAIGFSNTYSEVFKVTGTSFSNDFGKLIMKEDVKMLGAVEVKSMRPTVTAEADKLVVSVEGTALAAGSTAMEVLEKSPGVWVDQEGNIQLNGKSGVRVMIDGRPSYLSVKELQSMLQGMSAENLKNIELITNPSAKYDAEGSSGIINLELKKNTISGLNGSANTSYTYNVFHSYSAGLNLNFKKGRWNSFISGEFSDRARGAEIEMIRQFKTESSTTDFYQNAQDRRNIIYPSLRLGTDFEINDSHSIGGIVNLTHNYNDIHLNADTEITSVQEAINDDIYSKNHLEYNRSSGTFNLHYNGKLDTVGTTLSANADYVRVNFMGVNEFINQYQDNNLMLTQSEVLSNDNPYYYDIYSAKTDFSKKIFKSGKLEAGLKASHVASNNKMDFFKELDEERIKLDSISNHFVYKENILAGYVNFSSKLNEKWNIQAGLRAEQTFSEGHSVTLNTVQKRNYLDLFPSVFVQQKVNDNYQISYSYSRRIDRPNYSEMNPLRLYIDPYTYQIGNPGIRPQYTHSFQVTQTIKRKYNLMLGYSNTKDLLSQIVLPNSDDKTTTLGVRNIDRFENISATLVAPVTVKSWWEVNNNGMLAYQSNRLNFNGEKVINEALFYRIQSTHNFMLPHSFRIQLNTGYQSPTTYGIIRIEDQWWVDLGVKKSFLNDQVDVSLSMNDIFKGRRFSGTSTINNNSNTINQYYYSQNMRISLSYKFSKGKKFKAKNNRINLDELNRAGG